MNEFVEYLHELLHDFGPIQAKKMFGGYGIYHQGLMFGLVADDTLYLKSYDESMPQFEAMQLPAFRYQRQGKEITMSFHQAPADMLEQADEATHWAGLAYAAALRSKQRK